MVLRCIAIALVLYGLAVALVFRILPAVAQAVADHLPAGLRPRTDGRPAPSSGRSAADIRHPAMVATRAYLAAHPLPMQRRRRMP
ncbi:hypothetical protein [Streptomyces sp. NPDC023838]|uniref:hypothetical protein n=1 Tax=Streptomyces sp. NPDC023838 TaxID=3154325 RepID=UPI00340C4120